MAVGHGVVMAQLRHLPRLLYRMCWLALVCGRRTSSCSPFRLCCGCVLQAVPCVVLFSYHALFINHPSCPVEVDQPTSGSTLYLHDAGASTGHRVHTIGWLAQ